MDYKKKQSKQEQEISSFQQIALTCLSQDPSLLMTKTLHNQSLHTSPGDPWPGLLAIFLGRSLCCWKDGSQ